MTHESLSASLPRNIGALGQITRLLDEFFATRSADRYARYAIELAVEEVFTNMVRHNTGGTSEIRIDIVTLDGEVVVTVTDRDAPPFDPFTDAPPPGVERQLSERVPGGLGVHLVKRMIDRIEYSHNDRTATVTLRKRAS